MTTVHGRSAIRLFVVAATLSLLPVLTLGLFLASSYRAEARRRGIAEGRSEAELIARTAIEPRLGATPLRNRITGSSHDDLMKVSQVAIETDHLLRLRLRNLAARVVFSSDDHSGFGEQPEDEALDAARGASVARLTHVNADSVDSGPTGVAAVEVYLPLRASGASAPIGVLEIYLPYAPIRNDVTGGLHDLLVDLVVGLAALWAILFAISWSVSRGLRRQVSHNAFLAGHDALTTMPNRRLFLQRAAAALARARMRHEKIAIAIVDLDRFKEVNDSLGHHNGDVMLVELARRLSEELESIHTVARLGGDEFGLVVEDVADVELLLARVRATISRELMVSGIPVTVEASIGFVIAPDDGDSANDLLQRADVALYVAKTRHAGVARYDADQDHYDPANLTLISELRRAIDADELVLHYQPKAAIADGRFESVEALVRWNHPTRGMLSPDKFLPLAEQTELIEQLTDWVLARALDEIRDLHSSVELGVAVNVSASSLSRADFPDRVLHAIGEAGIAPNRLTIEITETALMSDPDRAAIALSQLDAFGVKISLDDFGTGQTALGYLSSLPIDELKIDKSFVCDMLVVASHRTIVRSIIDLGHNLGLRVVAEGIETEEILHALRELGCDVAQGFLLARPMPVDDLPRLLSVTHASASEVFFGDHVETSRAQRLGGEPVAGA